MGARVCWLKPTAALRTPGSVPSGGGVDLERGEVGGDAGPGVEREEVAGDGYGEGGAFFGVGGGAELVEQDERGWICVAGDVVDVDDVGGEAGEIALDGLGVADVGEDGGEEGEDGLFGGNGQAGLGHEGEQAGGLERDGFAAGVGAGDDELAGFAGEGEGEGDGLALGRRRRRSFDCGAHDGAVSAFAQDDRVINVGSHAEFEEGVAGVFDGERGAVAIGEGGGGAVEVDGEAGAGEVGFDFGEDGGAEGEGLGVRRRGRR